MLRPFLGPRSSSFECPKQCRSVEDVRYHCCRHASSYSRSSSPNRLAYKKPLLLHWKLDGVDGCALQELLVPVR
eukprot:3666545-Alexandrium_andersonii.AAC.1